MSDLQQRSGVKGEVRACGAGEADYKLIALRQATIVNVATRWD